jgi:hypothetical protein
VTLEAAHEDEPEPVTCGHIRRRMDGLLADWDQLMADVEADPGRPDLGRRMTQLRAALLETRDGMAAHVFADRFAAARDAERRAAGRHRAPRQAGATVVQLRSRPVRGIAPAAILAALAGHGARKAITAHLKLGLTAATAAGVTAAGVTYTIARTPDQYPYAPAPARIAPAAASPSDSDVPAVTLRHPKPKGKHHKPEPQQPALAPPAPAPPPTPPPPPPAVTGTLDVPDHLTVALGGTALLDITAQGDPVTWTATATDGITLDVTSGTLGAGQAAQIQVTVDPGLLPGTGQVTVNGQQITVTWG